MADKTPNERRLALRNKGFRAAAFPARRVTPKQLSSEDEINMNLSDKENASPMAPSPTPPKPSIRPRSAKVRGRVSTSRRSVSGETRQYIDHLETELQATQTQLSAATSPSLTRQQGRGIRALNDKTSMLQKAVDEWERKYSERVQEVVDQYAAKEAEYQTQMAEQKFQIKELAEALEQKQTRQLEKAIEEAEQEADERVQQALEEHAAEKAKLQHRIALMEEVLERQSYQTQTTEMLEIENIRLEKKLNTMSDLLASSTNNNHNWRAETPDRKLSHGRAKSMLPRFPTTGNLLASPERRPVASPALSFPDLDLQLHETKSHHEPLEAHQTLSDYPSEAESIFSEAPIASESFSTAGQSFASSLKHFDMPPPAIPLVRGRPMRKMRRFGAGSVGPRPLILPAVSHCDNVPASAPALERHEMTPEFPFTLHNAESDEPSPMAGRRRASTMADQLTLANLATSELLSVHAAGSVDDTMRRLVSPSSVLSQNTPTNFSSWGSRSGAVVSRNLLDELNDCSSYVRTEDGDEIRGIIEDGKSETDSVLRVEELGDEDEESPDALSTIEECQSDTSREVSQTMTSGTTAVVSRSRSSSLSLHNTNNKSAVGLSMLARIRLLFGDLCRSPVEAARHLIQSAQSRMRIPASLRNVQWWLFGILLGPMARRRFLIRSHDEYEVAHNNDPERQLLLPSPATAADAQPSDALAYGTIYATPPYSSTRKPRDSMAGPGKKRTGCKKCGKNQGILARHSPWQWMKFSITLAFAVGCAFKSGPASLLRGTVCACETSGQGRISGMTRRREERAVE